MVVATGSILGHENGPDRRPTPEVDLNFAALFDRVLDAVVVARLSTGRIVLWNPAAERLFGYTADEAIGQRIEMLMPESIANLHHAGMERYLRTGRGLIIDADAAVEMPAQRKDGEGIRVELSLSELSDARGERFAIAVMRDAMHRKQLELTTLELMQERVARSDAQEDVNARDELLDAIVATLRTNPTPTELLRLTTALLDFKRLHGGQLTVHPEAGDLVDLLHAAADAVRHRSGRRMLVHAPPGAWASFDPTLTRQVLEQVLGEAARCGAPDAPIHVRLEQPSVKTAQLVVRVEGRGAERELGVGLQLSRTFMQRQGGTLTVALTVSGGLEVVLTFPGRPHPARWKARRPPKRTGFSSVA